jgi:hypothetical protein
MKPRVLVKCVANTYSAPNERIIEYSDGNGKGGLIAFRILQDGPDGTHRLLVELYRHDVGVEIHVCKPVAAS